MTPTGVITPGDMGKIVTFEPEDGALEPEWNTEAAQEILSEQLGSTEVEFRNASFEADGRDLKVIPSQDGVLINWEDTLDPIEDKLMETGERTNEVAYDEKDATYTTEMAERASFDDVVGSFSSGGFASDWGHIRRTAELVDGRSCCRARPSARTATPARAARPRASWTPASSRTPTGRLRRYQPVRHHLVQRVLLRRHGDAAHTPHSYYIDRYRRSRRRSSRVRSTCSSRTPTTPRC